MSAPGAPARGVRFALCNEVLGGMDFAAQSAYAAAIGYDGLDHPSGSAAAARAIGYLRGILEALAP